jgi:predicted dienelactone hydrolase
LRSSLRSVLDPDFSGAILARSQVNRIIPFPIMSVSELLILIFITVALVAPAVWIIPGRLAWLLPSLAALAIVGQLGLEGLRWQLGPAYLAGIILLITAAWRSTTNEPAPQVIVWIGWGLMIATLAAAAVFPAVRIPDVTGPFAVGTTIRHLIDTDRAETLAANYHGPRELMVQFWYPTDLAGDDARPRDDGVIARVRRTLGGTPRRRSIPEAPVSAAQARYPVVIFSPSWRGQRDQNLFQVEELASHGYVVVGIDHPYMSRATVFPDGRVAHAESSDFWDLSSVGNLGQSFKKIERELAVRVKDIEFVANELERSDRPGAQDHWSGRLDRDRIGILGYSFGGTSGAQVCREDPRFKAGIDMGGSMFGQVAEAGVPCPFLFIDDETPRPVAHELTQSNTPKRLYAQIVARDFRLEAHSIEKYGGYAITINGTEHGNYTDQPSDPALWDYLAELGRINPERGWRIINAYTVAFFDRYLKHIPQPLLQGPSRAFPEVRFTCRRPPAEARP